MSSFNESWRSVAAEPSKALPPRALKELFAELSCCRIRIEMARKDLMNLRCSDPTPRDRARAREVMQALTLLRAALVEQEELVKARMTTPTDQ